ncbi:MAG: DUF2334 domain-containing protein [Gemmatimonadales bacterium]
MTLLVSIHDVTPAFQAEVEALEAMCTAIGVVSALLVVPDWHGQWPLERHPAFVRWLRERADAGAEIILHGERHDESGLPRTLGDTLRALGRTACEGEFLTLDYAAARTRIERGLAKLCSLGLAPLGFIPPAWLCREETHRAAADLGLRFTEDEAGLRLHPGARRLRAPAVRWSARTGLRAHGSALVARARWILQGESPIVRIALHPSDLRHPVTRRSVEMELTRWAARRPVARYAECCV